MEQPVAAMHAVESSSADLAVMLIIVLGLIIAIIGSLALLAKRNQNFISDFNTSSDK